MQKTKQIKVKVQKGVSDFLAERFSFSYHGPLPIIPPNEILLFQVNLSLRFVFPRNSHLEAHDLVVEDEDDMEVTSIKHDSLLAPRRQTDLIYLANHEPTNS